MVRVKDKWASRLGGKGRGGRGVSGAGNGRYLVGFLWAKGIHGRLLRSSSGDGWDFSSISVVGVGVCLVDLDCTDRRLLFYINLVRYTIASQKAILSYIRSMYRFICITIDAFHKV